MEELCIPTKRGPGVIDTTNSIGHTDTLYNSYQVLNGILCSLLPLNTISYSVYHNRIKIKTNVRIGPMSQP